MTVVKLKAYGSGLRNSIMSKGNKEGEILFSFSVTATGCSWHLNSGQAGNRILLLIFTTVQIEKVHILVGHPVVFRKLSRISKVACLHGVFHRDIKRGNFIFSCEINKGYLLDFNVAKVSMKASTV
uniref:Protein kinase domain-containing protein n=1 Tax=Opuntia streptacantha TaxID=393608 RepID=A0A7C9DD69_OPUST